MLQRNGLHLHKGSDGHALAVIVEGEGKTIWLWNFATFQSALDVLEDEILEEYDRNAIEAEIAKNKAYFTEIESREGGYKDHAFKRYVLV
ncbi:MAG TPA: hypothetical protein VFC37_00330 [Terracidiphilus sp.]|nr:hypothetical protein [Terracidiphilus sp.]